MEFKMIVLAVFMLAGVTYAAPAPKPKADVAFVAPVVASAPAAVVTATSSQFIARNYNGLAAPLVAAPAAIQALPSVAAAQYVAAAPYAAYPAYASPYVTYV